MAARFLSLLALLALTLMPFGMAAPAAATVVGHSAMAMGGAQHCPGDSAPDPDKSLPGSHCTAACSLVLPAAARVLPAPAPVAAKIVPVPLTGLIERSPETSTPPPKVA